MNQGILVDLSTAFNIAVALAAFFGGFVLRDIQKKIADLEKSDKDMTKALTALQVALPTSYVHKDEFKASLDAIHAVLRRIEDKMDQKMDKE
jgi:hypothetical protein